MRKQVSRSYKISYLVILMAAGALFIVIVFAVRINSRLDSIIELTVSRGTSEIITDCIGKTLDSNERDWINISKDSNGNIISIDTDSFAVNKLCNQLEKTIGDALKNDSNTAGFPVGAITGIDILSGSGFTVNVEYFSIGDVHTEIKTEFEAVGINQTRHCMKLVVSAEVSAVMPVKNLTIDISQEYLLSETVIYGQIPEVYLASD